MKKVDRHGEKIFWSHRAENQDGAEIGPVVNEHKHLQDGLVARHAEKTS